MAIINTMKGYWPQTDLGICFQVGQNLLDTLWYSKWLKIFFLNIFRPVLREAVTLAMFPLLMRVNTWVTHCVTQINCVLVPELAVFCTIVIQLVTVTVACEAVLEYFWPGVCCLVTLALILCVYINIYVCIYIF